MSALPWKTVPATSKRRRTMQHVEPTPPGVDDKAAAVLAGARSVFLTHGFSAATTDMIQKAAAVSKATVYARYATKEALFKAVMEAECDRLLATMRTTAIRSRKLQNVLGALAQAYLQIVLSPEALALFRAVVGEAPRFPMLARQFYLVGPHGFNAIVQQHLEDAASRAEADFSSVGVEMAASQFVNLVRGEVHMQCLTHPGLVPSQSQLDQWVATAVTTFLRAFGKT